MECINFFWKLTKHNGTMATLRTQCIPSLELHLGVLISTSPDTNIKVL